MNMLKDPEIFFGIILTIMLGIFLYFALIGLGGEYDCQMAQLYSFSEDKLEIFCKGKR